MLTNPTRYWLVQLSILDTIKFAALKNRALKLYQQYLADPILSRHPLLHVSGRISLSPKIFFPCTFTSTGVDPGEVKWVNFHPPPPFFLSPLLSLCFSYPSNIEIIFDFSDIITKIHPPFQNPGSALAVK